MPQKLARRKYQELIKFLKRTMTNESAPTRLRMQAAERLDGIYQRAEAREEKDRDRLHKALKIEAEAVSSTPEIAPVPRTAEQAAEEFLAGLKAKAASDAD